MKPTKVYRAECEDGGGPYYFLDGTPRDKDLPSFPNSEGLYGADSLDNLIKLITSYGFNIFEYKIVEYDNIEVLSYNPQNGHMLFKIRKK